jgi:hypothetical protein
MRLGGAQSQTGQFREEKNLDYARNQTPYHPACSLVTIQTVLYSIFNNVLKKMKIKMMFITSQLTSLGMS